MKKRIVKICAQCSEIMPYVERVCYCGGPIKLIKVEEDKATVADSYYHRRWLNNIRKGNV